ncbi:MAG: hypothetical protein WCF84_18795 [Anaerolineae bacterium]
MPYLLKEFLEDMAMVAKVETGESAPPAMQLSQIMPYFTEKYGQASGADYAHRFVETLNSLRDYFNEL